MGGVFSEDSLTYYWKWNVHITSHINSIGIGDIYPEVLLKTALSVRYFRNDFGEIIMSWDYKKEIAFFYNIYKLASSKY